MAKRKGRKSQKRRSLAKRPPRKIARALDEVEDLLVEGDVRGARERLERAAEHYPRNRQVLLMLLELSREQADWMRFATYCARLLPLERGEERAETLANLAIAYLELGYPALVWETTRELLDHHPDFEHGSQMSELRQSAEEFLQQQGPSLLAGYEFGPEEQIEILAGHDRIRYFTESGQYQKAIAGAEKLLERGAFVAVQNNLSLALFISGRLEQAIATAKAVLAKEPQNVHALANLVHFLFLSANFDEAEFYCVRLKQIAPEEIDLVTKQMEAFAWLGYHDSVLEAYERVKARDKDDDNLSPLILHLAAAAYYRVGEEKKAWRLWRQAVKLQPGFEMAQEALADRHKPVGQRSVPWYWTVAQWLLPHSREEFSRIARRSKREARVRRDMQAWLDKHPAVSQLFPHMLERGNAHTRETVLNLARITAAPEALVALADFVKMPYGRDELRMEVANFLLEKHPEYLPDGRRLKMWLQGEEREITLLGFEIYWEGDESGIPEEIAEKYHDAVDRLIAEEDLDKVEQALKEVIEAAPDFAPAYNQLALVYERQGRAAEAQALVADTHERFPDYFFSRAILARYCVRDERLEEARVLLDGLMQEERLHISEFRVLARAQMDYSLALGETDSALSWLEIWRGMEEDNRELVQWEARIKGSDGLLGDLLKLFARSS